MGARVGAGLRAGLVAGLWVGQAYGVSYLPGFGLAVPAPWLLDTQPPFATQLLALTVSMRKSDCRHHHYHNPHLI